MTYNMSRAQRTFSAPPVRNCSNIWMGLCQNAEKRRGIPIRTLTPRDVPFILHGTTMITEGEEKLGTGVWHSRVRPESNHNSVT